MDSERDLQLLLGVPDNIWLGQVSLNPAVPELGVGSDATVFRTTHEGQNVAAKVLHRVLIAPGNPGRRNFIRHFGEECRRLRELRHPCIVSFIGVGQAPNKCPCLVVELMEDSLASRIGARPADPFLQTLSYLVDAAAGLRYLHWLKIIHRDLKPQNILIVAGSAKLADVGIARSLHGDENLQRQVMTRCPGTPNYMAPESLDESKPYDERLDIFACGVIVVAMFTDHHPNPKIREIIVTDGRRVPTSELVRRSDDIARLAQDHPARSLALRCITDDPSSRPSAAEFYHELRSIQQPFVGVDKNVLSPEIAETVSSLRSTQEELASTREELTATQLNLTALSTEHTQSVAGLCQDLTVSRQELAATRQAMTTLSSEHSQTVARLNTTRQELAAARQSQMVSQTQVTELRADIDAQRQQIQSLMATVQQLTTAPRLQQPKATAMAAAAREPSLSSEAAGGVAASLDNHAEISEVDTVRSTQLQRAFLKNTVSKRKWSSISLPSKIQGCSLDDNIRVCVHLNEMYAVFKTDTGVHLFKYGTSKSWAKLTVPANILRCYGIVSGDGHLFMVNSSRDGGVYAARLDGTRWLVSTKCPRDQCSSAVTYDAGRVHLLGGNDSYSGSVNWSTSVTADLRKWSMTVKSSVLVSDGYFPAAPYAAYSTNVIKCQDTWFYTSGFTGDDSSLPVYHLQGSRGRRSWEKTRLLDAHQLAGCISHLGWVWYAGGRTGDGELSNEAYCTCVTSNDVIRLPSLPSPICDVSMIVFNDTLMVFSSEDWEEHAIIYTLSLSE